jgi:acyl-coenzyme A thioesterase PaaI-like protein
MTIDPLTLLMRGREVLAEQPFSRLLGAQLNRLELGGLCELELPLRTELLQQNGFAHGGVVSYLADNALTYAGGAAASFGVVTAEFKINFVRPAIGAPHSCTKWPPSATSIGGGQPRMVARSARIGASPSTGSFMPIAMKLSPAHSWCQKSCARRLIARAEAVSVGKNQIVCRCDVFVRVGGDEKLCAVAQGTIARVGD